MNIRDDTINWLLEGDASIRFQVFRDLLHTHNTKIQDQIENEGWGKLYLDKRKADGHWGLKFYQPKWTSTHYTLLDLRNLCIRPSHPQIQESIQIILQKIS